MKQTTVVRSDRWAQFGTHRVRVLSVTMNHNESIVGSRPLHRVDAVELGKGAIWFYVNDDDVARYLPVQDPGPDTSDTGAADRMRIL
jgi:hypothetical protein